MSDYILRQEAINEFCDYCIDKEWCKFRGHSCSAINNINAIPPADVRHVVYGNWVPDEFADYHWCKCSVCGVANKYIETIKRKGLPDFDMVSVRNFCPVCGADMRDSGGNS